MLIHCQFSCARKHLQPLQHIRALISIRIESIIDSFKIDSKNYDIHKLLSYAYRVYFRWNSRALQSFGMLVFNVCVRIRFANQHLPFIRCSHFINVKLSDIHAVPMVCQHSAWVLFHTNTFIKGVSTTYSSNSGQLSTYIFHLNGFFSRSPVFRMGPKLARNCFLLNTALILNAITVFIWIHSNF